MDYLAKHGFPVLSLGEAVSKLQSGDLPDCATVITIDDGFYSTFAKALPALRKRGFAATVYVTSYHSQKGTPVFRLAVQYLFWATQKKSLDLGALAFPGLEGVIEWTRRDDDASVWRVIRFGEERLSEAERQRLVQKLAAALEVDWGRVDSERRLHLMTPEEISDAARSGIDIQLHTHRHRFPVELESAKREISQNRAFLEPLIGKKLRHFCYPSGVWGEAHWPILKELGIASATTCEVGLNDEASPPLALNRFLDDATVSPIEFEAEMSGFAEVLRSALRRRPGRPRATSPALSDAELAAKG